LIINLVVEFFGIESAVFHLECECEFSAGQLLHSWNFNSLVNGIRQINRNGIVCRFIICDGLKILEGNSCTDVAVIEIAAAKQENQDRIENDFFAHGEKRRRS